MSLELLSNAFVFTSVDPRRRLEVLGAMRSSGAFSSVHTVGPWCVGETAFDLGPRQPAGAVEQGVVLVQAPPELVADPDVANRVWRALAPGGSPAGLPGDVGAVHLDPAGTGLVAMTPVGGRVPWYWSMGDGELALGTRLAHLHHFAGHRERDRFGHAAMAGALMFPDDRTPLAGVSHLGYGRVVRLRTGSAPTVERYWIPPTPSRRRPTAASTRAAADGLRTALIAALRRELDPEGRNLLGLSGGVDSSSLASLAVRVADRPIATFSHVPAWESDHPDMAIDYITPLIAELGIVDAHRLPLSAQGYLDANLDAPRVGLPVPHQALGHLGRLVERTGAGVLTGGELADDLFGGTHFLRYDWISSFSLPQLLWRLRRQGGFQRSRRLVARRWIESRQRRWTRRPSLPVPPELAEFYAPELRSEYLEWRTRYGRRMASLGHPYLHVLSMLECDGWLAMNWEACSALGVRRSIPFVTREVIELALRCHPQEHAEPSKRLLRIGLAADVPALNLQRPDKGFWGDEPGTDTFEWDTELPAVLEPILAPGWFPRPARPLDSGEASELRILSVALEPPVLRSGRSPDRAA